MRISTMEDRREQTQGYELLDSGGFRKLERFGRYVLSRPCAQAIWPTRRDREVWDGADAVFERRKGRGWQLRTAVPDSWQVDIDGLRFRLARTDFGHVGLFPEQRPMWRWIREAVHRATRFGRAAVSVLNLFAYSGGATLAAAVSGARVCHVDASKGMVGWARKNAEMNGLGDVPVRWIVDDAVTFLGRETRRGSRYDAVILDPPTYGHGRDDEVFKIEDDLVTLLRLCWSLLSDRPLFVLLSSHTPFCTPVALTNIMTSTQPPGMSGSFESGEMLLTGAPDVLPVPSGTFCRWVAHGE